MLNQFRDYINSQDLFSHKAPLLIAVSGGLDSVVLGHLCYLAGFNFSVAHVNYNLRGADSTADEAFVKQLATLWKVPFHSVAFHTAQLAQEQKIGIQDLARRLRYEFFERIMSEQDIKVLATAHHADDNAETMLFKLIKGSGVKGLRGIVPKRVFNQPFQVLVRPLLFASKAELLAFAEEEDLTWREDVSNLKDDYSRNYLRHQVMPLLEKLNPNIRKTLLNSAAIFRETTMIEQDFITQTVPSDAMQLSIHSIQNSIAPVTLLYSFLSPFNFNRTQVEQLLESLDKSGTTILSSTHRCTVGAGVLQVQDLDTTTSFSPIIINDGDRVVNLPDNQTLRFFQITPHSAFESSAWHIHVDYHKLKFPLTLRLWENGDRMQPLGMKGLHKKVSDILVDQKVPLWEKEQSLVLCNANGEIIWLLGHRQDERFKVEYSTARALVFTKE